jgi:hypothetical protein
MLTQLSPIGFGDAQWLSWSMFGLRLLACGAVVTAGTLALALGRGSSGRALAATIFFVCLPLACIGGAVESVLRLQTISALAWTLALYLGGTAGLAVARRESHSGVIEIYAMMFAAGDAAFALALGAGPAVGLQGPLGMFPHEAAWAMAATSAVGAALDLAVILRGGASASQRGVRGIWRTGGALAICVLCTAGGSLALL